MDRGSSSRGGAAQTAAVAGGGRAYVRYLPDDVDAGDPRPDYLTVGTYPVEDAYPSLKRAARKPGAQRSQTDDDALVVTNSGTPTSVYLGFPQQDLQIEVFDPDPAHARELAESGDVRPAD